MWSYVSVALFHFQQPDRWACVLTTFYPIESIIDLHSGNVWPVIACNVSNEKIFFDEILLIIFQIILLAWFYLDSYTSIHNTRI